jgi:CheY-like chemotaxis protein
MTNNSCLLIVDDEEHVRDTLELLLAAENYQLAFATNGQEALKTAEDLLPDLILLDVMMPVMDGYEVCERLRANPKLAEVPIIMLTALDDRESRLRGIKAGADDFLTKPVDRVELRARIHTIIRLNRYRRLLTERSRFEWAIEQFDDGFLLLGDGDVIRYINSAARLYLGIVKDSDLADGFLQQVDKRYKREPTAAWESWPSPDEKSQRYLVRPETRSEPPLWLQVDVREFSNGNAKEQLVHLRDVSEHMLLQWQMWSFQMQVSHKLRTPLNALTILPMLTGKKMELSSGETQSMLEVVQEATERLQEQILEILQYVDASQLLKLNTSFSLSEFPSLLSALQGELELETVTLSIDNSLPEKTLVFSKQGLELVLRELLGNAQKFHPQQSPQIEVEIKPADAQTIILSVSDNGQHLPGEVLTKVWTPYFQAEKCFSGEVKGMGLGLAMVARLVWGSGGNCRLYNRDDQPGIRVEVTLPLVGNG